MPRHGGRIRSGGGGGTETVIVEVPVDTDVDIPFADTFEVFDQLSGTLGPIFAEDSFELSSALNADELTLQESLDASDSLNESLVLDGISESFEVFDQLSGTLGPVIAPDTFEVFDAQDIELLDVPDSVAVSDAPDGQWSLDATQQDGFAISDAIGDITQFEDDSLKVEDDADFGTLTMPDTFDAVDAVKPDIALESFLESMGVFDAGKAEQITTLQTDSVGASDELQDIDLSVSESLDISDSRQDAVVDGTAWPDTVELNNNFTNPGNMTDEDTATFAQLNATQSSGLASGSSQTTNGTLEVSFGDIPVIPEPLITSAVLEWGWTTNTAGLLPSGNSVDMDIEYSIDDGATWQPLETVTATATTGDNNQDIAGTQVVNFSAIGSEETWVVPAGVNEITVDMAGAEGGDNAGTNNGAEGLGGRVQATLTVTPGETLRIGVGEIGGDGSGTTGGVGGFYNAGDGGDAAGIGSGGGGGGGQSYIKRGGTADSDRVLVAGGGGGTANNSSTNAQHGGHALDDENVTAVAATDGGSHTVGNNNGGGGGGAGWRGGAGGGGGGGGGNETGGGGTNMAHSTQTSNVTSTEGFQSGDGYVEITYQGTGLTWTEIQQLQFRATGSVTSGTVAVVGGAQQNFRMRYARLQLEFEQVL